MTPGRRRADAVGEDLARVTGGRLAQVLEARTTTRLAASDRIFAMAAHGHEKFSEVVTRLGEDHLLVTQYRATSAVEDEALAEARARCGPTDWPATTYPGWLRNRVHARHRRAP